MGWCVQLASVGGLLGAGGGGQGELHPVREISAKIRRPLATLLAIRSGVFEPQRARTETRKQLVLLMFTDLLTRPDFLADLAGIFKTL